MELNEKQKQKIEEVAKKYKLKLVVLFGSMATGKVNKESDFDVAYLPENNLSYDDEVDINLQFTYIFYHDRVDTVNIKRAAPLLLYAIFRECLLLFAENDLIFSRYRAYAFKKYIETKPLYEEKFRRLKEKINKIKNDI